MRVREFLRPPALKAGDTIGVVAPSFPLAVRYPRRLQASLAALREKLELESVIAPHVYEERGFQSGSAEDRAVQLQNFFDSPEISAVFTTLGGLNSNELLPFLDFERLRGHPKIFIGYSDTTALQLALTCCSGWVTFSGPALMPQLGEFPEPFPFTLAQMRQLLMQDSAGFRFPDPACRTFEFIDWGSDEAYKTPRAMEANPGRQAWRSGSGTGVIIGGNLETLNFLIGTPYFDPPDHMILYVEATESEAHLPRFQRALVHLRQAGVFDKVRGLLVGQCPDAKPVSGRTLPDMILDVLADFDFPILGNMSLGHVDPMLTLPNGCKATLEVSGETADFQLLESAVQSTGDFSSRGSS